MKRVIKIGAILVLLFAGTFAALFVYFQKNIQPLLIAEINQTLAVKVGVDDISITGVKDFPKIGIQLSGVTVDESTPYYKDRLITAEELSLYVDIFRLYQGEYVIDAVSLKNGKIQVADLMNTTNYEIIKPSNENESNNLSFEINHLRLINCALEYTHIPSETVLNGWVNSSDIRLNYINNLTQLDIRGEWNKLHLTVEEEHYIREQDIMLDTRFSIDNLNQQIEIGTSKLNVNTIAMTVGGRIDYSDHNYVDITFQHNSADARELIKTLPESFQNSLQRIDLQGNLSLKGHVSGSSQSGKSIALQLDYALTEGKLMVQESNIGVQDMSANGSLTLPNLDNMKTAGFTCKIKSASNGKNQIGGDLSVHNFTKPVVQWNGQAILEPMFVYPFVEESPFVPSAGSIIMEGNLSFGYNLDRDQVVPQSFNYTGKISLNDIKGTLADPKLDIQELSAELVADDNQLFIKNTTLDYNQTHLELTGNLSDLHAIFDGQFKSKLIGDLTIRNLNINELLPSDTTPVNATHSQPYLSPIPFQLQTIISPCLINDFKAQSITGLLQSNQKQIELNQFQINALEGNAVGKVSIQPWGEDYLLDINSTLESVSIEELFKQFNNFYQTEITDKNLSGMLSGTIISKVILDSNFEPILPKIYVKSDIEVQNGALVGYEPLSELSSFVRVEDLENVTFNTLRNSIEIFDETIFIPKMRIENNALNLSIEGTHTFNNEVYYAMELSVAELLATKANWIAKKAEKRIERNKNGGLTAYIIMEGTPDNLTIKYDRSSVKENIKQEFKDEKKKFIQALKGQDSSYLNSAESKNYDDVWDE